MLNRRNYDRKIGYFWGLLISLDILILIGLGINTAQIIVQWVNLGGVICYVNMWTGYVRMSNSVVWFCISIAGYAAGMALFTIDLIRNILNIKKLQKEYNNFEKPVEND